MSMVAQRVTQRTLNARVERNLQRNVTHLSKLQEQLSSGRLISRPSDSPTGTVSAMRLRSEIRRSEQHHRNADDGIGWLGTADSALTGALDAVRRVRELALRGANASASAPDRAALAAEAGQLREHLLSLANTTYLNQPIFAGTANVNQAFAADGTYQGNAGAIGRTVGPGVTVQVNVTGADAFGSLFTVLANIENHFSVNTTALNTTDLTQLDQAFLAIQDSLAVVGARYHQVEAMADRSEVTRLDASNRLAEVESIDLPKTIMDLQLQEVAYQAALGASARVLQPSLLDFLK
jgi:flagellar hook-associated protein 3 FlgL